MAGYGIQIRKTEASPRAVDPGDVMFKHHRAEYAQVKIETLTGGQPPVPHVVPHLILA
jgi:hypothetical protein